MRDVEEYIPTRKSLLSRLKNLDDQDSWRLFFETYWKLIYRAALRAGLTEAEAEDVVQETVIAMSKNIRKFEYDSARGSFKTYLMRMTNWRIAGQFRKRMPIQERMPRTATETTTDEVERLADPVLPALEALWDKEWEENLMGAALQRAKAKTDPKLYQVFDLYVRQKWPASRVARDLHVSRAKVYLAKHLIGKLIKREIERLRTEPI